MFRPRYCPDTRGQKSSSIVSNEPYEIILMLNSAFDAVGAQPGDYYPKALYHQIDALEDRIYETLNNGVYLYSFATIKAAYEAAFAPSFFMLYWLEAPLD